MGKLQVVLNLFLPVYFNTLIASLQDSISSLNANFPFNIHSWSSPELWIVLLHRSVAPATVLLLGTGRPVTTWIHTEICNEKYQ